MPKYLIALLMLIVLAASASAWWNVSYLNRMLINCSLAQDGSPIMVNGSNGVLLPGGAEREYIWTTCQPESTYIALYYIDDTTYQVANETSKVPMEVEVGAGTSFNPTGVWTNYSLVLHFSKWNNGTSIFDSSPNNGNVYFTNATPVWLNTTGFFGNAMRYIQTGDKVSGSLAVDNLAFNIIPNSTAFFVEGWYRTNGSAPGPNAAIWIAQGASGIMGRFDTTDGQQIWGYDSTWRIAKDGASQAYDPNAWIRHVWIRDKVNVWMITNNTEYTKVGMTGNVAGMNPHVHIGGWDSANNYYNMPGLYDELRISNINRTLAYYTTTYNNGKNLVGYGMLGSFESGLTPPTITSVVITPNVAYDSSDLGCQVTITSENETATARFTWMNGTATYSTGSYNVLNNTPSIVSNLSSSITAIGENWSCRVIANTSLGQDSDQKTGSKVVSGIVWNYSQPTDINSFNLLDYIFYNTTYRIYSLNTGYPNSSIRVFAKTNRTTSDVSYHYNGTSIIGYYSQGYSLNTTENYMFRLSENGIYRGTYNILGTDTLTHTGLLFGAPNEFIAQQLLNISSTTTYNVLEFMLNSTSTASPLVIRYCNSSFSIANGNKPDTSTACGVCGNMPATTSFAHTHTANSKHNNITIPINITTGMICGVKGTASGTFVFSSSKVNSWDAYYTSGMVRANAYGYTANAGTTWSLDDNTLDMHLHQYDNTSTHYEYACYDDYVNTSLALNFDVNTTTPLDYSPSSRSGTTFNITWTNEGKYGGAYLFDGNTTRLNTSLVRDINPNQAFTVSGWFKPNTNTLYLVSQSINTSDRLLIYTSGNSLKCGLYNGSTTISAIKSGFAIGVWNFFTCIYLPNGTMYAYANGVGSSTSTTMAAMATTTGSFIVGSNNYLGTNLFNGTIDEVKVWNRALSEAEILNEYNNQGSICSDVRSDSIDLIPLPPHSPVVYLPVNNSYGARVRVNWTPSTSPTGQNITGYNITLINATSATAQYVIANVSPLVLNTSFCPTNYNQGDYYVRVQANDNDSLFSYGFSDLITLDDRKSIVAVSPSTGYNTSYQATTLRCDVHFNSSDITAQVQWRVSNISGGGFITATTTAVEGANYYNWIFDAQGTGQWHCRLIGTDCIANTAESDGGNITYNLSFAPYILTQVLPTDGYRVNTNTINLTCMARYKNSTVDLNNLQFKLWQGGSLLNTTLSTGQPLSCYQEYFNVSTACGGRDSGSYQISTGSFASVNNLFDGDWGTSTEYISSPAIINLNYTIPAGASGAIMQYELGNGIITNVSIPSACWSYSSSVGSLMFKLTSSSVSPYSKIDCYTSISPTTTMNLANSTVNERLYEEAIYWNITDGQFSGLNIALPSDATYQWECVGNDTSGWESSSGNFTLVKDTTPPVVAQAYFPGSGQSFLSRNITGEWNWTDLNLYRVNVSIDTTPIYMEEGINLTAYTYSLNRDIRNLSVGSHLLRLRMWDSHTAESIEAYDVSAPIMSNKISFDTGTNEISIDAVDNKFALSNPFKATQEVDKYTFTYEPSEPSSSYSFVVTTKEPMHIIDRPDLVWKKWIVSGNNWVDFYMPNTPGNKVDIEMIDDYNAQVVITKEETIVPIEELPLNEGEIVDGKPVELVDDKLFFSSIGDLNMVEVNYTFYTYNVTLIYTSPVDETQTQTTNLVIDRGSANWSSYANFSLNGTSYTTTSIVNATGTLFDSTFDTPISTASSPSSVLIGNWSADINGEATSFNFSQVVKRISIDNCSTYTNRIMKVSIYNENTPAMPLVADMDVQFNYTIGALTKQLNIGMKGNSTYYVCVENASSTFLSDVYLKYVTNPGFTHRYYLVDYNFSGNIQSNFSVYNFNTTTDISLLRITTKDYYTNIYWSNVIVKLQRYYVDEGVWRTVQMDMTDLFGLALFHILEQTTDYRLLFYSNNTLVKQTDSVKFACTSGVCSSNVLLKEPTSATNTTSLDYNITYDGTNGQLQVNWQNPLAITTIAKFKVTRQTYTGTQTLCNTTQSGAAGTITCNTSGYTGAAYLSFDADSTNLVTKYLELNTTKLGTVLGNDEGGFWTVMIIIACVGFGLISPAIAIIAMMVGLVAVYFLGIFTPITVTFLILAAVLGIFIGFKVRS